MGIQDSISQFLNFFSISKIGFNWVDFVILIVLLFYIIESYSVGLVGSIVDLVSFIMSFVIGLKTYVFFGNLLVKNFSIPAGFSLAIGFLTSAFISEMIIRYILRRIALFLPSLIKYKMKNQFLKTSNHVLGIIPGIFSALILMSFLLTLIVALPTSAFLKDSVSSSRLGNLLVAKTQGLDKKINGIFGGAINETINFLTVEPKSNEIVELNFKTNNLTIDTNAQKEMFTMVNKERTLRGIAPLIPEGRLADVARAHCEDMFMRGYFSHYTPEGLSPFDRMAQADITFTYAGENLALAPNVTLAMQGLMQSPGHRANILSVHFGKVGIGVIDGGIYGEMFCQEFTD